MTAEEENVMGPTVALARWDVAAPSRRNPGRALVLGTLEEAFRSLASTQPERTNAGLVPIC